MRKPPGGSIIGIQTIYKQGLLTKKTVNEEDVQHNYEFEDKFTEKEIEHYKEGFAFFDRNNDGTMNNEDLSRALSAMGVLVTNHEIKELLKKFDPDNNGSIELNDFLSAIVELRNKSDTEEDIKEAFSIFDKEDNGLISIKEFTQVLTKLGDGLSEDEIYGVLAELYSGSFRYL